MFDPDHDDSEFSPDPAPDDISILTQLEDEGDADEFEPAAWVGDRSSVAFSTHTEDGACMMTFTVDGEMPINITQEMATPELCQHHAAIVDLGLALAADPNAGSDDEVVHTLLGLVRLRDFLRSNHSDLSVNAHAMMTQMSPEDARAFEKRTISSIDRLDVIASRLTTRLEAAIGKAMVDRVAEPVSQTLH